MRARALVRLALIAVLAVAGDRSFGQEPLFLRIRAQPLENEIGEAERARAAREAVWERSERRARRAIASVCTGCLIASSQDITVAASPSVRESGETSVDRSERLAQADARPISPGDDR